MTTVVQGRTVDVANLANEPRPEPEPVFYCHSSESMPELESGSVALTVTSPPYWNSIDYNVHVEGNGNAWYRTRKNGKDYANYDEYLTWCQRIFAEVLRVTKPGGFCAVVVGTVLLQGAHRPVPFDLVGRLVQAGWEFHQDIIWHKCTAGVKRAGVTIQNPYPGYYYPNIMTEYILVFRKPGAPIYAKADAEAKAAGRVVIDRVFTMDTANNIWHIAPIPPGVLEHPCPFPEEIPYRLINLYSYPDDVVLDPFVGSGQTTKVARNLGRNAVGYDTEPRYAEYARFRAAEPLSIRQLQLVAVFEKVALAEPLGQKGPRKPKVNYHTGKHEQPDPTTPRLLERPAQFGKYARA